MNDPKNKAITSQLLYTFKNINSYLITELHNVSPSIFSSTSAILLIPLSLLVVALSKRSKP